LIETVTFYNRLRKRVKRHSEKPVTFAAIGLTKTWLPCPQVTFRNRAGQIMFNRWQKMQSQRNPAIPDLPQAV